MNHEPPWKAVKIKDSWDVTTVSEHGPSEEHSVLEDPDEEAARLIAAAPALRDQLAELVSLVEGYGAGENVGSDLWAAIRAANEILREIKPRE
jgi:hypothetical protein